MKKLRISRRKFLLAAGAACLLTGCGASGSTSVTETEEMPELRIGVDILKPFCYIDTNGDYAGIDADIAAEVCRRAGYQPVFVQLPWAERDNYLENGTVDCLCTAFIMDGREDSYLWTDSYLESELKILVDARAPSGSLDDFRGPGGIAVRAGSRSEELLLGRKNASGEEVKVHAYGSFVMAQTAFVKSYVDALAGQEVVLRQLMEDYGEAYCFLDETLENTHLGIGFRKGSDPAARDALNEAMQPIAQADMDGQDSYTVWQEVLEKPPVQSILEHPEESYSDHITLNGVPYDYVVLSRGEDRGLLLCYASAQKPNSDPYEFSISNALTNNNFHKNPVVVITDGQNIVSTNHTDIETVQAGMERIGDVEWKEDALTCLRFTGSEAWYGLRRVYGTYMVFVCYPEREVFANRTQFLLSGFLVYLLLCIVVLVVHVYFDRLKLEHTKNQLRILKEMHEAEERSFRDSLTGLYNRNYLEQKGEQFVLAGKLPISLIMADCNYLKWTNDTFGHEVGDQLLQRVAQVLQENTPEHCRVIRAGGDEFVILCQNCPEKQARKLVAELKKKLAEASDETLTLSVAFGVYTTAKQPFSLKEAYDLADQAMYAEKQKMHAGRSASGKKVVQ